MGNLKLSDPSNIECASFQARQVYHSRGKSGLEKKCSQLWTPFSNKASYHLSLGVIHFVLRVSTINQVMTGQIFATANHASRIQLDYLSLNSEPRLNLQGRR